MSPLVKKRWAGTGWEGEDQVEQPFILEVTIPRSSLVDASNVPDHIKAIFGGDDNVGLIPGVELEPFDDYAGSGHTRTILGSGDISNPRVIENKIIYGPVKRGPAGQGNVLYRNCLFTMNSPWTQVPSSGGGPAYTGLIDCRTNNSGTDHWTAEHCLFDPGEEFAHPGISAFMGHHLTVKFSVWQRVVDGGSVYRITGDPSDVLAVEVFGCINVWNAYFWNATAAVVHTSDYYTHNDAIQVQGGGPGDGFAFAIDVRGNAFLGYNFLADGVTIAPTGIPNGHNASRHLAHQGVLLQQNQSKGTPITARVRGNWFAGFAQPLAFKTSKNSQTGAFNGTVYDVEVEENRFVDDDHKFQGSGVDHYGVSGGNAYPIRLDSHVLINGQGTDAYPADLVSRTLTTGNNRYGTYDHIHPSRRGQLLYVRRDSTPG